VFLGWGDGQIMAVKECRKERTLFRRQYPTFISMRNYLELGVTAAAVWAQWKNLFKVREIT